MGHATTLPRHCGFPFLSYQEFILGSQHAGYRQLLTATGALLAQALNTRAPSANQSQTHPS